MRAKFQLNDKHRKFVAQIATGEMKYKAYQNCFPGKHSKDSASVKASQLLGRPQIQELLDKATKARNEAIQKEHLANLPAEFKQIPLTVDEIDSFHYSVLLGRVEVEELIIVHTIEEIVNEKGQVVKKIRKPSPVKVKRAPNVREKQASADAIYKRFGSYAPAKLLGAFGKVNDDGEMENVERFALLSTGEKIPV